MVYYEEPRLNLPRTIISREIDGEPVGTVKLPQAGTIIHAHLEHEALTIYVEVNADENDEPLPDDLVIEIAKLGRGDIIMKPKDCVWRYAFSFDRGPWMPRHYYIGKVNHV